MPIHSICSLLSVQQPEGCTALPTQKSSSWYGNGGSTHQSSNSKSEVPSVKACVLPYTHLDALQEAYKTSADADLRKRYMNQIHNMKLQQTVFSADLQAIVLHIRLKLSSLCLHGLCSGFELLLSQTITSMLCWHTLLHISCRSQGCQLSSVPLHVCVLPCGMFW